MRIQRQPICRGSPRRPPDPIRRLAPGESAWRAGGEPGGKGRWTVNSNQTALLDDASSVARHASAVLLITSIHHAYGAYVYDTPWRYHAVIVAGVTAPLIFGALAV